MANIRFVECSAPAEAFRVPEPTIEQIDNHPDRAFLWAIILATRKACREHDAARVPRSSVRPFMG